MNAVVPPIDLVYAPSGRISRVHLLDAIVESGWLLAWMGSRPGI